MRKREVSWETIRAEITASKEAAVEARKSRATLSRKVLITLAWLLVLPALIKYSLTNSDINQATRRAQDGKQERSAEAAKSSPESQTESAIGNASDLSSDAQAQLDIAKEYLAEVNRHTDLAKEAALSKNLPLSCKEFNSAALSATAVFSSIEPVAREIKLKRPEVMAGILAHGESLTNSINTALDECKRIGF